MFRPKSKPVHSFIARIPELNYVLLRDSRTKTLELWTQSRGIELHAIVLEGFEFEYVRDVVAAYRVMDVPYNRTNCPHEIGRVYLDSAPIKAFTKEL